MFLILRAKPNLLIVGGTGFIGYHLALKAKKKGWSVSSLSLNNPKKNRYIKGVNYIKCDVGNLNSLKKVLINHFVLKNLNQERFEKKTTRRC